MIRQHELNLLKLHQPTNQAISQRQIIQQVQSLPNDLLGMPPELQVGDYLSTYHTQQHHRLITHAQHLRQSFVHFQLLRMLIDVDFSNHFEEIHESDFHFFESALRQA